MTKEEAKYRKSQQLYLDAGRRYTDLLLRVSKSNRKLLQIATEIKSIGDNIHVFDSPVITKAYNEIISNSRISPEYHGLVKELEKVKSDLDIANYQLVKDRLKYFLAKSGVPYTQNNYSPEKLFSVVNNPNSGFLEKLSVAAPYVEDEISRFVDFIDSKEIQIKNGKISAATRDAKNYLRNLELTLMTRVNNSFISEKKIDIKDLYSEKLNNGQKDLFIDMATVGDQEHIRELERRLLSGDVTIEKDQISPLTTKGKRYLDLLDEEFTSLLEKKLEEKLINNNNLSRSGNKVLNDISRLVDEKEEINLKHKNFSKRIPHAKAYRMLSQKYDNDLNGIKLDKQNILNQIDAISLSAISIKKKLLLTTTRQDVSIKDSILLASALAYLGIYENQLSHDVSVLAGKLDIDGDFESDRFKDIKFEKSEKSFDSLFDSTLSKELKKKTAFQKNLDLVIHEYVYTSKEYKDFEALCSKQNLLKMKLADIAINQDSLYSNFSLSESLLVEIIELETKKKLLVTELLHQADLAHKKIWLDKIKKDNNTYIDTNFDGHNILSKDYARKINEQLFERFELEIKKVAEKHHKLQQKHPDEFYDYLKKSSQRVKNGEDVSKVSKDMLNSWNCYNDDYVMLLDEINTDMKRLESYLGTFGEKSRKEIEKNLILDIRKRVRM
ncbi:MAG: hypothetical protein WCP14_03995 [bacterium]